MKHQVLKSRVDVKVQNRHTTDPRKEVLSFKIILNKNTWHLAWSCPKNVEEIGSMQRSSEWTSRQIRAPYNNEFDSSLLSCDTTFASITCWYQFLLSQWLQRLCAICLTLPEALPPAFIELRCKCCLFIFTTTDGKYQEKSPCWESQFPSVWTSGSLLTWFR